jgi:hypothetical protein
MAISSANQSSRGGCQRATLAAGWPAWDPQRGAPHAAAASGPRRGNRAGDPAARGAAASCSSSRRVGSLLTCFVTPSLTIWTATPPCQGIERMVRCRLRQGCGEPRRGLKNVVGR